jgi:pimeloyl-ACP methyl ester carboxylesterase/DNA-binding CsgD family transcriptional regulator
MAMPHRAQQQIRFCRSRDGTRIAYAICGSGPPLVWLGQFVRHLDLDWDTPVWRPWLSFLSRRHTLIRYDFRGCGLSDREGIEFSLERHVEDLEAVVDAAKLDRFVLFAMAGGAPKASVFTVRHPERVSHLILYGPPTRGRLVDAAKPNIEEAETRLKAIELGWSNTPPAYGQFYTSLLLPDAPPELTRSYNSLLRETLSAKQAVALLRAYWRADVRTVLPQIDCPTLVMHPRNDSTIPFEEGRKVAALVPGARFVPLETSNHIVLEGEPAWTQLTQIIEEFLPASRNGAAGCVADLTPRERDLLEFVAQGWDNNEIAARLNISVKTVRNHVSAIFNKLGASTRAQVIVQARDAGFGRRR